MIKFANPGLLWLLWLNIPIIYLWYYYRRRPGTVVLPCIARARTASLRPSLRYRLNKVLIVLRIIAFSCLIIALARPQSVARVDQVKADVVDIIITRSEE